MDYNQNSRKKIKKFKV